MQQFVKKEGDFFDKELEEARAYLEAMAENDRKWELTFYIRTIPADDFDDSIPRSYDVIVQQDGNQPIDANVQRRHEST